MSDEDEEDGDHDQRGAGDRARARRQALGDRAARVAGRVVALADAAEQEDLVVHRQAEDDREHERRRDRVDLAEHERQHAVRGADAQQVHHHRLERQDDAAQQDEQHDVRQAEDEQDDLPHRAATRSSKSVCVRGRAADGDGARRAAPRAGGRPRPRPLATRRRCRSSASSERGAPVARRDGSATRRPPRSRRGRARSSRSAVRSSGPCRARGRRRPCTGEPSPRPGDRRGGLEALPRLVGRVELAQRAVRRRRGSARARRARAARRGRATSASDRAPHDALGPAAPRTPLGARAPPRGGAARLNDAGRAPTRACRAAR